MSLDNLPVEWLNVKISDVSVKSEQRKPNDSEEFIYVDIGSINRNLKKIENPQFLLGKDAPSRARKVIKKGDVLVSLTRPNLNAVALVGESYDQQIASTGFEVISPLIVESKYLFSLVRTQHFVNEISKQEQGALYPAAKSSDVQAYEFPLPPLAEQQEIVRQLDVMFAQVEQIKARLDAIPAILKKFRQSVLADAVSGKLTESWRKDDLKSWKQTEFSKICREITVGFVGKMSDQYKESGIPFLRSQNVRAFKYSDENLLFISEEFHSKIYKSRLEPGDLAIVRSGAPGTTCVIPKHLTVANCSDLVIARPSSELNPYFGCIFMNSEAGQRHVSNQKVGVAQQHFNVGSMKKMEILLPPIDEQNEIVNRVENFFKISNQIENQILSAQNRVNLLNQSILAKAFSGELTAEWREQHRDLITGLNSAESLLAKIQAERIQEAKKNKRPITREKKVVNDVIEPISVIQALTNAAKPLNSYDLFIEANYPSNSETELVEKFYLDLRSSIENGKVLEKSSADGQPYFELNN